MHKGHRARELFSSSMIIISYKLYSYYKLYKYKCLYLTIRLLYYLIKSTRSIYDINFKLYINGINYILIVRQSITELQYDK